MRDVFLAGVGRTPVRRHGDASIVALGASAVRLAIEDAGIEPPTALSVGNMLAGSLCAQRQLGAMIAEASGLAGIEASVTEAACASGAAAMRWGVMAIASGYHDVVVVVGAERMTHAPASDVTFGLATATDREREGARGETFLTLNARLTREYLERYGLDDDALFAFSANAHANGARNPGALFQRPITRDDYERSRMVEPPVRIFDASPICDGAAAVVLASSRAIDRARARVRLLASSVATDVVALSERRDPLVLDAAVASTRAAYGAAGIEPRHVDVFELHDAFAVMAALALEAAGFARPGEGHALARDRAIALDGSIPVSTMGGLKARGHPVGASGVYQIVEAYLQLASCADACQVRGARIAMAQSFGGTGSTVYTHLLERVA